jgi:hypothetical protein
MKISRRGGLIFGLMLAISPLAGAEDKLGNVIDAAAAANQKAAEAQQRVDALATDTKSMIEEYRQVVAKSDDLKAYNDQVERMLATQKNELATLSERARPNAVSSERLLPLLQKMVDTLDTFVKLDAPFLVDERANRVKDLKALIDLPDVSLTEKYRRVMEAYQVEAEYGRTIEAYTGELPADQSGKGRTVNFLRVGRMALLYSTLDGGESGFWDAKTKSYQPLASEFGPEIERGLKIARKEAAPDLLKIPLPAPERVQ